METPQDIKDKIDLIVNDHYPVNQRKEIRYYLEKGYSLASQKERVMKSGTELIAEERQEQLTKHKRTIESDVALNNNGQLIDAATQLINIDKRADPMAKALSRLGGSKVIGFTPPINWNVEIFSKMIGKPYKERLIVAGALIAAELDRLNSGQNPERSVATEAQ